MAFDYTNYGKFKSTGKAHAGWKERLANFLGVRSRYVKFMRGANRRGQIVELGCGDGSFMLHLQREGFTNIVGIEPSVSYSRVSENLIIRPGYAKEELLLFKDASISAVVALDVLEHVPSDDLIELFEIIERKLEMNGIFVIRVPNMASPFAMINFFGDVSHVTPLNEISITQLVFGRGFSLAFYPEPLSFPRSIADGLGIVIWTVVKNIHSLCLRAFGIRGYCLTPNLVVVMTRVSR